MPENTSFLRVLHLHGRRLILVTDPERRDEVEAALKRNALVLRATWTAVVLLAVGTPLVWLLPGLAILQAALPFVVLFATIGAVHLTMTSKAGEVILGMGDLSRLCPAPLVPILNANHADPAWWSIAADMKRIEALHGQLDAPQNLKDWAGDETWREEAEAETASLKRRVADTIASAGLAADTTRVRNDA